MAALKSLAVAATAAGLLSACATYDYGYSRPYYGYDYGPSYYYDYGRYGYGYSPYYYDYAPGYYYGGPSVGFDFTYRDRDWRDRDRRDWRDRDRHDWRDRDRDDRRRVDGDRRTSRGSSQPSVQNRTAQRQNATQSTPTNRGSGTAAPARGQRIAPAPVARTDAPQRNAGARHRADVRAEQRE